MKSPALLIRLFLLCFIAFLPALQANTEEQKSIEVLYLQIQQPERPILSNLDPIPEDLGIKGAELGTADNNTTGSFLGYQFKLDIQQFEEGETEAALAALNSSKAGYVLLDMNAEQQLAMINDEQRLFFNVSAYDVGLRNEECRVNLLHTLPSYAMRTDALMQFLIKKQWDQLSLLEGNSPEDALFAKALRRSAKKYQLEFGHDEKWLPDGDLRRQAGAEVPLLTQTKKVIAQINVGVEPEGMAVSPDGKVSITTSETTNMAHWIDTETNEIFANTLVDARPRHAEYTEDGKRLWVSSEIGGTVTVFNTEDQSELGELDHRLEDGGFLLRLKAGLNQPFG